MNLVCFIHGWGEQHLDLVWKQVLWLEGYYSKSSLSLLDFTRDILLLTSASCFLVWAEKELRKRNWIAQNCCSPVLAQTINWKGFLWPQRWGVRQEGAGDNFRLISSSATDLSLTHLWWHWVQVLHTIPCPRGAPQSSTAEPSWHPQESIWELWDKEEIMGTLVRERETALGSGIPGNNRASSFLGCVLPVHALQLELFYIWDSALVNYPGTMLRHTCSHSWRGFLHQLSRLRMNEMIRAIIPEGGQLKKTNENKTVQTFGLCPFLFPLLIYNCSNDYSWRDLISCISPFFGNSGPKYILGCTLKTKGVNVLNEFHMQCRYYMDDI